MDEPQTAGRIIFEKVIPVRVLTPTRSAIQLVVRQRVNNDGLITAPTVNVNGQKPLYIESWKFCLDYGAAWIVAAFFMIERQPYIGNKA